MGSGSRSYTNGSGTGASFYGPDKMIADDSGNIYVNDNSMLRRITPSGVVSTLAGNGTCGFVDGTGTSASVCVTSTYVVGSNNLTIDSLGNLYFVQSRRQSDGINYIYYRKITPVGVVSSFLFRSDTISFTSIGEMLVDSNCNAYISADRKIYKLSTK